MDVVEMIVLAVVQGITEFLPISSDGHLAIVQALFDAGGTPFGAQQSDDEKFTTTIALHAGTFLSILVYFHKPLWRLLGRDWRVIGLLIAGTVPAAIVGLGLKAFGGKLLVSPLLAGLMLPLNGLILLWVSRRKPGDLQYEGLTYRQVLWIGLWQAAAPLPGISRSGTTIASGLSVGLDRDSAATFSFLLAVPAIGGAILVESIALFRHKATISDPWLMLLGVAVSFVVGLIALYWLIDWLRRGRLDWFAYWCIFAGLAVLVWQLAIL